MRSNILVFKLSKMIKYCEMYKEKGDSLNWGEILKLEKYPMCIVLIHVVDDNDESKVLAYANWTGVDSNHELKFGKVEVKVESLRKHGIGETLMKIVIAIAKHFKATKITGVIAGDPFLWDFYKKLGFTIYDENKLCLDISPDH